MENSESMELLGLLQDIERRSLTNAAGMPKQEDDQVYWEGVLCRIAGSNTVVPLREVKEILNFTPTITLVPGTKNWMVGVANIRGNLLPIIDLQQFLGGKPILIGRRTRVLVCSQGDVTAGLLVENVVGMRHFPKLEAVEAPALIGPINEYIQSGCEVDGKVWPIFEMDQLVGSTAFQVAAA